MCCAPAWAQTYTDSIGQHGKLDVEAAYTFAEQHRTSRTVLQLVAAF